MFPCTVDVLLHALLSHCAVGTVGRNPQQVKHSLLGLCVAHIAHELANIRQGKHLVERDVDLQVLLN
jgi:hypothetical protein